MKRSVMLRLYFIVSNTPVLRTEPIIPEKGYSQVEVIISIKEYFKIKDVIKDIQRASISGTSSYSLKKLLKKIVLPRIVTERDRIWFKNNYVPSY